MARTLVPVDTCDLCKRQGLPDAEAGRSVILAIDGPPKRFELCPPHIIQLEPFAALYADEDYGVDESLKPKKRQPMEAAPEPKQLESVKEPEEDGTIYIQCPLPHKTKKGDRINYAWRSSHATEVHGLKVWDIKWQDPTGALTYFCDVHEECGENKLAFPSKQSLSAHIRACPLPQTAEVA